MWKLSTSHSAAGVIARSSRIARAIARYESNSTRPFSTTRGIRGRPWYVSLVTVCADARLPACCSSRSTLNSSARMGSSRARIIIAGWFLFGRAVINLPSDGNSGLTKLRSDNQQGRIHRVVWDEPRLIPYPTTLAPLPFKECALLHRQPQPDGLGHRQHTKIAHARESCSIRPHLPHPATPPLSQCDVNLPPGMLPLRGQRDHRRNASTWLL